MTTINKSKATIINRGLTSIIIVICFLFSLFQSQEAYAEKKKVTGTSKRVDRLLDTSTLYDQTKVELVNNLNVFSSADPDWDKAIFYEVLYYVNPAFPPKGDEYRGCGSISLPNGDNAFIKHSGSWQFVVPKDGNRWTGEFSGRFTGGTGKLKGIRGTFKIKGKGDGFKNVTGEWDVEYEKSPINN